MSSGSSSRSQTGDVPSAGTCQNQSRNPPLHCVYVTHVEPVRLTQQWRIEHFEQMVKLALPGHCIRTNMFRDAQLPEACWQLCLYPGGKRVENANHVSLFLKMSSTSPTREVRIKVEYRFHFVSETGSPLFTNINVGEFHAKPPKGGHSWGLRNIPQQKIMNCVQSDGSLVIVCHIELIPDINRASCYSYRICPSTSTRPINANFVDRQLEALEKGVMADCVVECNGQEFPVNKFVLASHSEVFKAMFSYETMENTEKRVIIQGADVDSVRWMLRYMYTGEVDLNEIEVENLLVLAERYQVDDLKSVCERKLCITIDQNNVVDMLLLADTHNCRLLRRAVVNLIRSHRTTTASEAWKQLKEDYPRLTADVMEEVMCSTYGEEPPPAKRQRQLRSFGTQSIESYPM